jgi:hypothetical protein
VDKFGTTERDGRRLNVREGAPANATHGNSIEILHRPIPDVAAGRSGAVEWSYTADDLYTRVRGSAQKVPNGNGLVTESDKGHVSSFSAVAKRLATSGSFRCSRSTRPGSTRNAQR